MESSLIENYKNYNNNRNTSLLMIREETNLGHNLFPNRFTNRVHNLLVSLKNRVHPARGYMSWLVLSQALYCCSFYTNFYTVVRTRKICEEGNWSPNRPLEMSLLEIVLLKYLKSSKPNLSNLMKYHLEINQRHN